MARGYEHIPTIESRRRVSDYIRAGIPKHLVAKLMDFSEETLNKYYKYQIETAMAECISGIAAKVAQQALEGCEKSQALYLKTQGARYGFVEKQVVENVDSAETQELRATIAAMEAQAAKDF